jgi:hypothetical protein
MKLFIPLFIVLMLLGKMNYAQKIPVEAMTGTENYWYQHVVAKPFSPNSSFGFFNVSTLHIFYNDEQVDEIMSQSYITYRVNGNFFLQAGSFYVSGPGFSPSLGFQLVKQVGDLFFLLVPRVDIKRNGSYDAMAILQYRPKVTDNLMCGQFGRVSNQNLRFQYSLREVALKHKLPGSRWHRLKVPFPFG